MDSKDYGRRKNDFQEILKQVFDYVGIDNMEPRDERYCERCDSQLSPLRYHLKICANCSKENIAELGRENKGDKVPKLKFPFAKSEYIPVGK